MNPIDILGYGHKTFLAAIEKIPNGSWETPGVCGIWSAQDLLAHLASFELWHGEVLERFLHEIPQPLLAAWSSGNFNDEQVSLRKGKPYQALLEEYNSAHLALMEWARQVPLEIYPKVGTLPWYGEEYGLDDFLVYSNYGHKREHSAQLNVFTDQFNHADE